MAHTTPTVFVCAATGSQGGALAHLLRQMDWKVRTTTRNVNSVEARKLQRMGVHITEGDWDNGRALNASIAGCDKVFLCLFPNFADMSCERRQAQEILRIAKAAGVKQVVASTSLGVSQLDANVHVPAGSFMEKHLSSKKAIEQAVLDTGFTFCTFLRPAFSMANFIQPKVHRYPEICEKGTWTTTMTAETQLPLIDHVDIGKVAVAAFQSPAAFDRRAIGLASELLTVQQILDQLADAAGKSGSFKAVFMTDDEISAQGDSNVL
ncbi:hypothetical protein diail_8424, partial [Diaporthe ilicicola]